MTLLSSPVNWAGRDAQVETMMSTVEEGLSAIADTIDLRPGSQDTPQGTMKTNLSPIMTYNIKERMQGLEKNSNVEVRNDEGSN